MAISSLKIKNKRFNHNTQISQASIISGNEYPSPL